MEVAPTFTEFETGAQRTPLTGVNYTHFAHAVDAICIILTQLYQSLLSYPGVNEEELL